MDGRALSLFVSSESIEKACLDSLADTDLHFEGQVGLGPFVYSVMVPPVRGRAGSHPSTRGCETYTVASRFVSDVEVVEGIEANLIKNGSQPVLGESGFFRLRWKRNGRG